MYRAPQTGPLAARSVSTGRQETLRPHDQRHYNTASLSRDSRTQKSIASISHDRSRSHPSPFHESRHQRHTQFSRSDDERSHPVSHRKPGEPSFSLNDMVKIEDGSASSRARLEDNEKTRMLRLQPDSRSIRGRNMAREEPASPQAELDLSTSGTGIWNRVAVAASTMTVNVSKAWATNIATFAGEETPPGQESRLLRAMKAYHLEKARDPTDLPTWLFDEHERRPVNSHRSDDDNNESFIVEKSLSEPPRSRGLRHIYETAASTDSSPSVRPYQPVSRNDANEGVQPSKATDRLKALRDAKRHALASNTSPNHPAIEQRRDLQRGARPVLAGERSVRVGIPSGPGRSRPF